MPKKKQAVLLTWVAVNNDPYERDRSTGDFRKVNGRLLPGPTLTLLKDPSLPYMIEEAVFFHSDAPVGSRQHTALQQTVEAVKDQVGIKIATRSWKGDDPTDHQGIFKFLRKELPVLREKHEGKLLVVHVSPGTPAMHTVWVLMAETGMIPPPVELVKSYRPFEQEEKPSVVTVKLGLETFFQVYQKQQGFRQSNDESRVLWDPDKAESQKLKDTFAEALRFAKLSVPVLIFGERGTGKTTLASWIRANSDFRKDANDTSWPAVPCGQYTIETMRDELFGHRKGAFTDAKEDRDGLLSKAHKDTLFLDEIGDISVDVQRLLIKAIEEQTYSPLGSTKVLKSQFRLITATNRDLAALEEKLDPDFLDRIGMLRVRMPALREIREDIFWIWRDVIIEAARRASSTVDLDVLEEAAEQALPSLQAQHLPGNMRDLFVVAYHILAALGPRGKSMPPRDAANYALASLQQRTAVRSSTSTSQLLMKCFAESAALDPCLDLLQQQDPIERIETGRLEKDVKRYVATEIRRYVKDRGLKPEDVCDRAERTLRQWAE